MAKQFKPDPLVSLMSELGKLMSPRSRVRQEMGYERAEQSARINLAFYAGVNGINPEWVDLVIAEFHRGRKAHLAAA